MPTTKKVADFDRAGYTSTEKRLIAVVWVIACATVFLLMRR